MSNLVPIKASSIINVSVNGTDTGANTTTTSATVGTDTTFTPEGFNPQGIATWKDRSVTKQVGQSTFTLSVRPPTKASPVTRVTAKLVLPVLETPSGGSTPTGFVAPDAVAYQLTWTSDFLLPQRCTLAEREKFFSLIFSLMAGNIQANDASPTDATASPIPQAVMALEKPY